MIRSVIEGTGYYVPERVVTNEELTRYMDTSDAWIRERSGIEERRWVPQGPGGDAGEGDAISGAEMAKRASVAALEAAGVEAGEVDAIVLATLSPDHFFPGTGVFLQRELGLAGIPALDVRAQCTGFVYGLSVADAWIRTGQYRTILLVGVEIQSTGIDPTTRGRDIAVLFGDGAGAALLRAADVEGGDPGDTDARGVLSTHIHADGRHAEVLWADASASCRNPRISREDLEAGRQYPTMVGKEVFKHAVTRMPEAVQEALETHGLEVSDIDLLIPHQANLRISQMVQRRLGLEDDQVFNNIQRYGNTTAATIPIALAEAVREGRLERGDLLCLVAFGSGFTWGSALVRW